MPSPSASALDYRHVVFEGRKRRPRTLRVGDGAVTRPRPLAGAGLLFVRSVLESAGIDITRYRGEPLARRIPACLRAIRAGSLEAAQARLREHPELTRKVVDAVLIGVTEFFRDCHVFEQLRERILPELRAARPHLAIWSAGCSTGEELYSIASLVCELGLSGRATFLGTDCRANAIAAAKLGRDDAVRVCSRAKLLGEDSDTTVLPALFRWIEWRVEDVFECRDHYAWDLILCRNLAIYLEPEASAQLWNILADALRPGGFLVVGKAERPSAASGLVRVSPCVFRKGKP